ncbi:transcription factor [Ganoderma sinense ZZ0214-1]|uniref:Vacuolar import and degradation protein 21 n=1 Tax=Ganoderma sinense ZZ0214-1 TaxID=1077348 RepID=A0A2G8RRN1_9APHY|nr:transcription factor [Ganoderma sinense ZZ0214-1]
MSQTADLLVEERVMQLQEISRRRNELLREMYHLIQKRDNLGSLVTLEDEEEESDERNLQLFLERFDLERHPDSGHIASLLDEEVALPETPPAYSPVCVIAPEPPPLEPENVVNVISESPMSEPPASPPPSDIREEEEEEEEEEETPPQIPDVSTPPADASMDVDSVSAPPPDVADVPETKLSPSEGVAAREPSLAPNTAPESPGVVEQELHPTQDTVPKKSPTPAQQDLPSPSYKTSSLESPVPLSYAESFSVTREPSSTRTSLPPSQPSQPSPLQLSHDEPDAIKEEPVDDEDMEVAEPEPSARSPSPAERTSVPFETVAPTQLTKEHSEDQIMAILGPSQQPSSPLLVDEYVLRRAANYAIPHPQLHPAFLFTFNDGADQPMAVEHDRGPHEFGPNPPYPLPPLHMLPMEFAKKKPKRNKREKGGDSKKEEWQPMGLNRWAAVLKANPVHTKLSRSTKCLSTRDWSIGITEMHLLRVFDRIEKLKDTGSWSFRQPKKQRGVGGLTKTHWDYLLDEMRWMRTDYREERRWKLALAYNLAHAVIEWHEAGSLEERVRRGIVVLWKPPPPEDTEMMDGAAVEADGPFGETQDTDENGVDSRDTGSQNDGYGSDDESEDEQDKDHVLDSLAPSRALQDALEQLEQAPIQQNGQDAITLKPKIEEIEDMMALGGTNNAHDANAMEVDQAKPQQVEAKKPEDTTVAKPAPPEVHHGLRASSKNPILGPAGKEGEGVSGKIKVKTNHPIRDHILYTDVDKLFIDLDDLDLAKSMSELSTEDPTAFPLPPVPPDLTAIFHDLPFYGMLDVAPPPNAAPDGNGKKKSDRRADRDDPNKRAEDAAYTKLTPTSKFMLVKPTLLGTLRPASNFKDGKWSQIEETPIFADVEVPSARPIDENLCALFEGTATKSNTPTGHPTFMPPPPRDVRKRNADHGDAVVWTPAEDALLKQAVEKYPYNWHLIADSFNSSRVTISTDKRSVWECMERWKEKFSAAARADAAEDNAPSAPVSASASHMTTRGLKRSANQSVAMSGNGAAGGANQGEPRKRRRHAAMHDTIKRTAKRREQAQKSNAAPRVKPTAVHDTHGQFTKLPKLTPAELSRMKAEKEARDAQELLMRRRNDELARQHLLREQAQRAQGHPMPPNAQPQTPQGQMLPPGANTNGVPRSANGVPQVAQIRSGAQVGISQQRIAAALAANATSRMSPPQLAAHMRAMAASGQAQAQAQAPTPAQSPPQGQVPAQGQVPLSNASAALTAAAPALSAAHLSPSFAARATSASPGAPHHSPPLPAASPPNATAVARPPSVPGQPVQGMQVNQLLQMPAQFYMQNMQGISAIQGMRGQFTQEQIHALLQVGG